MRKLTPHQLAVVRALRGEDTLLVVQKRCGSPLMFLRSGRIQDLHVPIEVRTFERLRTTALIERIASGSLAGLPTEWWALKREIPEYFEKQIAEVPDASAA